MAVPRPYHGVGSRPKIRVPLTYQVPQPLCLVPHPGEFSRFIALGDSLSIDRYPATANVATPHAGDDAALPRGLGAAALLYRNDDQRWPEFTGRDLATHYPGIAFRHAVQLVGEHAHRGRAVGGVVIAGMRRRMVQLVSVPERDARVVRREVAPRELRPPLVVVPVEQGGRAQAAGQRGIVPGVRGGHVGGGRIAVDRETVSQCDEARELSGMRHEAERLG